MAKEKNIGREAKSGRFVTVTGRNPSSVGKEYVGKIGSYSVRRLDEGRFNSAKKAASSSLKERKK